MALSPLDLRQTIASLAPAGTERLLVAYSGGVDSHVLLHLLLACRQPLPVLAVHLDHAIHPDSASWARHCERICRELGVAYQPLQLKGGLAAAGNLEERAREARYQAFSRCMRPGDLLLTAHHQDDQAETLLLQLLRGAGLQGLSAAAAVRPLGPGWLARPFLHHSRQQILAYAQAQGLEWLEDPSNRDGRFDRNHLRNELIPRLRRRWPATTSTLARSAGHLAEARALLEPLLEEKLSGLLVDGGSALQPDASVVGNPALFRALIRHWISCRGHRQPPQRRLQEFLRELQSAGPDRQPAIAWDDVALRRYQKRIYLVRHTAPVRPCRLAWDGASTLDLPQGLGRIRLEPGGEIDPGRLQGRRLEIVVGQRPEGVCHLPGRPAKSLKRLYQELEIPPWERPGVPLLLVDGEIGALGDRLVCNCLRGEKDRQGQKLTWQR